MKDTIKRGDIVLVPMMVVDIYDEYADITPERAVPDIDWDYSDCEEAFFCVNIKQLTKKNNEENLH